MYPSMYLFIHSCMYLSMYAYHTLRQSDLSAIVTGHDWTPQEYGGFRARHAHQSLTGGATPTPAAMSQLAATISPHL